ncbi:hypothetical protein [Thermococcus sp. Bubb.Bath]|uniref:hypothetical protein n=1 Tax=Thermococcus sp. Bubb.Bath TaxID=1638242 RepID=UPI00318314F3
MLFDPRPKKNRKELFDREREINALVDSKEPLILSFRAQKSRQKLSPEGGPE